MILLRNEKKIILGSWFGQDYGDNTKYFLRYLQAHHKNDLDITWVTKSDEVAHKIISEFGDDVRVVMSGSASACFHQLRAGFFFTVTGRADVDYYMLGGATHIELWHGLPLKKINYDTHSGLTRRIRRVLDYLHKIRYFVVSDGKSLKNTYCSAFDIDNKKVLHFGQCRTDVFFDETLERDILPELLRCRYIVYMPTHRYEGKVPFEFNRLLDLEFIDSLCNKLGVKFIIKKHFYHNENNTELDRYNNIVDITKIRVDPLILLKHSEALITDYSSCYIDYLLLGKPIVFYCYDLKNYIENERGLYREFEDAISSEPVLNKQALNLELEKILDITPSKKYIDACLFYHDRLPGKDHYKSASFKLVNKLLEGFDTK